MVNKVLFVCYSGGPRSQVAAEMFASDDIETKHCGISTTYSKIPLTQELVDWADFIFCMEEPHKEFILKNFDNLKGKKIFSLGIMAEMARDETMMKRALKKGFEEFM